MEKRLGQITFKVSDDERKRIRTLAESRGVSVSELMRELAAQPADHPKDAPRAKPTEPEPEAAPIEVYSVGDVPGPDGLLDPENRQLAR